MFTTLNLLKEHAACMDRYRHLCKALGGVKQYGRNTPISFEQLSKMNGLDDALWALRAVPYDQIKERDLIARLFAASCAEHVLPIYEQQYPDDKRVRLCIEASRRFAYGEITDTELAHAGVAAWAAWGAAARVARVAAWAAWGAAADAARAAHDAAGVAAWAAAADAARAAAYDAYAAAVTAGAAGAAWAAARAAADAAEQDWQKAFFLSLLENPPVQEATHDQNSRATA